MEYGKKISELRRKSGMTQAELGNMLNVTYQAVSKWERDESYPDFDTMIKLAKIFNVPVTYFADGEDEPERQPPADESGGERPIGVCTVCGRMLYNGEEAQRDPHIVCSDCMKRRIEERKQRELLETQRVMREGERLRAQRAETDWRFKKRMIWSFVVGGLAAVLAAIFWGIGASEASKGEFAVPLSAGITMACVFTVITFTWVTQLFYDGAVRSVTLAGGVAMKLPGIIFSFDLHGCLFLIGMKILLWILSGIIFVLTLAFTIIAAMVISLFTFIPVMLKIKNRDEDILG